MPGTLGVAALVAFLFRQSRVKSPLLPLHVIAHRARAGVPGDRRGRGRVVRVVPRPDLPPPGGERLVAAAGRVGLPAADHRGVRQRLRIASRLLPRVAPATLIVPGLVVAAAGLGLMSLLEPSSGFLTLIMPAQILLGLGMGCVFTPSISVATSDIEPRLAGVAAAVANTAMQVGGSVGTAC